MYSSFIISFSIVKINKKAFNMINIEGFNILTVVYLLNTPPLVLAPWLELDFAFLLPLNCG
jgi:hypothetical protein